MAQRGTYEDLIDLPHHVSPTRPRMSMRERAAQFSPFAALSGYDAAILETARLTDPRAELDEDEKAALNGRLQLLRDCLEARPQVTLTYFVPDRRKSGGAYETRQARVKKIDPLQRALLLEDGTSVPIDALYALEGTLFRPFEDESVENAPDPVQ